MFLTDAMRDKAVFGTFSKFIYRVAKTEHVREAMKAGIQGPFGTVNVVYCRSQEDFSKLLASWNSQSERNCHGMFIYTCTSVKGVPMGLGQIAADQAGISVLKFMKNIFLKSVLNDSYTGVEYIQ